MMHLRQGPQAPRLNFDVGVTMDFFVPLGVGCVFLATFWGLSFFVALNEQGRVDPLGELLVISSGMLKFMAGIRSGMGGFFG